MQEIINSVVFKETCKVQTKYTTCFPYWVPVFLCADASRALPEFPEIDLQGKPLPEGIELEHIKSFQLLYREHCEVTQCHQPASVSEQNSEKIIYSPVFI